MGWIAVVRCPEQGFDLMNSPDILSRQLIAKQRRRDEWHMRRLVTRFTLDSHLVSVGRLMSQTCSFYGTTVTPRRL